MKEGRRLPVCPSDQVRLLMKLSTRRIRIRIMARSRHSGKCHLEALTGLFVQSLRLCQKLAW